MKIFEVDKPERNELFETIISSKFFNDNILPYIIRNRMPPELIHGTYKMEPRKIINISQREKPVDTSKIIHDLVNKESIEKFGVPIRNLLFASQSAEVSENYGSTITLVPLDDDYQFYYSDIVSDMYTSSNGIFSFSDHNKKRGRAVLDAVNSDRGKRFQKEIYKAVTGSDGMSQSITYFLYSVIYSVSFYGGTLEDNIYQFNNLDEMNDPKMWTTTIKSIMNSLKRCYKQLFEKENIYDENDLNFRNAHNMFRDFAAYIIDHLIEMDKAVLRNRAYMYVSDVNATTDLYKINESHEIMCSTGRYATLSTFKGDLHSLVKYYKARYQ